MQDQTTYGAIMNVIEGFYNLKPHPAAEIFPMLSGEEFERLKKDIAANGQQVPIVVHEGLILDGRNRLAACVAMGIKPTIEQWAGEGSPVDFVLSMNLHRRHLTESQRSMVAAKALPMYEAEAKARQLATLKQNQDTVRANLPERAEGIRARDDAAKAVNVSPRSVENANQVIRKGAPELQQAVESGQVSVSAAATVASGIEDKEAQAEIVAKGEKEILEAAKRIRLQKATERQAENARLKAASPTAVVTPGKYRCIVIDPPWNMEKIDRDVRPNQVAFDYPTMTQDELKSFNVGAIADDDCHLFCWTTHRFLPDALELLGAWGFKYVLQMVWHKSGGPQPFGLPQYNCEFVTYGRKGAPRFVDTKQFFACFEAPRREHSRKPDEFYSVVRRVTQGPRIDVFSREARDGFDQWGNETERFSGVA